MRRTLIIVGTLLVSMVLILGACSPAPTPTPAPAPAPAPATAPSPAPSPAPVPEPTLAPKEAELKYDDGQARDSISTASPSFGGHIVDFSPPAITFFTIKKIRIAGLLSSDAEGVEGKTFDLQILDKNLKVLHSATYPYTEFQANVPTWVEFEVPNIEVADKFYVHMYTDSPYPGLHIGADDSVVNQHSDVTVRTAEKATILAKWPYTPSLWFGDKSKVNWMIRVTGTAMLPPD